MTVDNNDETTTQEGLNAFQIIFSYKQVNTVPGVIMIPAKDKEDAEAQLRSNLERMGLSDLTITSITDINDVPAFRKLVDAQLALEASEKKILDEAYQKELDENGPIEPEPEPETKVIN